MQIFIKIYIIKVVLVLCILTHSEYSDQSSHVIQGINLKSRDIVYIRICAYELLMCSQFPSDLFFQFKLIMSQSSSSSQARLELAEPDSKCATTTTPKPTSSSTCASLGLTPPRFPKRLAGIEVNSLSFDHGFDEK